MEIKGFKEIVENTGYKVSKKDREIFERAISKSSFGTDPFNDFIEVMIYDSSDNPLPQNDDGDLVRYIYLNDANVSDYFTVDETNRKLNDAPKYNINSERLVKDAGYTSGIFKTQVTLLNRRLGSHKIPYDKVWIHEISPSRTEVRVLPVKDNNDRVLPDLQERYNIFAEGGEFRVDTILGANKFIQSIDVQKVIENFLSIKGAVESGQGYINLIRNEFKVPNFEAGINRINSKFIEIMTNFINHREWNTSSPLYGKPLSGAPPLGLSVKKITEVANDVLKKLIETELPKQDLRPVAQLSLEEQVTFDEVQKVLDVVTKGNLYDSTIPDEIAAYVPVRGCTDPNASNFNPAAEEDDGTCLRDINVDWTSWLDPDNDPQNPGGGGGGGPRDNFMIPGCTDKNAINYQQSATMDDGSCKYSSLGAVNGCTNSTAVNYDPYATFDDGSCRYDIVDKPLPETLTGTWYCWCDSGYATYTNQDNMIAQSPTVGYNRPITIVYLKGTRPTFSCEFGITQKYRVVDISNPVTYCTDTMASNFGYEGDCIYTGPSGTGGGRLTGNTGIPVLDPTGIVYTDGNNIPDATIIRIPAPGDVRLKVLSPAPVGGIK